RLSEMQSISTLPAGLAAQGGQLSTAELQVHPSGKFLYGSNRGHNSLVIYRIDPAGKLALVGHETRLVRNPRHVQIDPTGKLLLVANQEADTITVFSIDGNTGLLTPLGQPTPAGKQPSFVGTLLL